MENNNYSSQLIGNINGVGSIAMLIAMTTTINDEDNLKQYFWENKVRSTVIELGGKSSMSDFQEKINKSIINACINSNLISKNPNEVHAVIHASEEAKKGILVNVSSNANLALKVAVVRKERWIAVAMFGVSAIHYMTNHERAGLGIMHI